VADAGPGTSPIVVVGPTASGKSDLAVELARRFGGGEVLTVDSMQVYRRMDIGTAKPTPAERSAVPHHLIDLVDPCEPFTLVDFQSAFDLALVDVRRRGATPVVAGGTGLYLRAAVDRLTPPGRFPDIAAELDTEPDTTVLHARLAQLDSLAASRMEPTNRRRVVRALEVTIGSGAPFSSYGPGLEAYPQVPYRIVGIDIERLLLDERIEQRYERQMEAGFLDEVAVLAEGELSHTASQALGYKELLEHLRGELSLDEALELAIRRTRRFARRQQRWFRRDPRVEWLAFDAPAALADRILDKAE
jgi:tRNA dimethylallyltransferase